MASDEERGKGKGQGKSKWDREAAEWYKGFSLYIKDAELAKYVHEAVNTAKNFRLVVDGAVVSARPADNLEPCVGGGQPLWKSNDMEWDEEGCLRIKDKSLSDLILMAKAANKFQIVVDSEDVTPATDGGPIGDQKVNSMCFC
ncbi:MAG TPA: hypothetical protein VI198_02710 [Candidatus Eisenbacteria bacterium]